MRRPPVGDGEQQPEREPDAGEEEDADLQRGVREEDARPEPRAAAPRFREGHEGDRDRGQEAPGGEEDDAVDLGGGGGEEGAGGAGVGGRGRAERSLERR